MSAPFIHDRPDFVFLAVRHCIAGLYPALDPDAIFNAGGHRGALASARARQIGMYVMAARLEVSQGETARQFGRDRSSVSHAVQLVEGLAADCSATAELIDHAERQARSLLQLFETIEAEAAPVWRPSAPQRTPLHG